MFCPNGQSVARIDAGAESLRSSEAKRLPVFGQLPPKLLNKTVSVVEHQGRQVRIRLFSRSLAIIRPLAFFSVRFFTCFGSGIRTNKFILLPTQGQNVKMSLVSMMMERPVE